ncbi:MAG: hypothetical protein MK105_01415 [Crocinitomicaceae bacterium]|nr:hypothetical protein [Crocinitomicaceae bacterium]
MKKVIFSILAAGVLFASCNKEDEDAVPTCVQERLASFEANEACGDGASVKRYIFNGGDVYAYNPGGCGADLTTSIIDENCNNIGYLGGITGNDTIQGVHFTSNAMLVSTIWKN